jgi:predicted solute-binding protein
MTVKKTVAKKVAKKTGPKKIARAIRFADAAKITVKVAENQKRKGTKAHAKFAKYKSGETVKQHLDRGVRRSSLRYDVSHGYIIIN